MSLPQTCGQGRLIPSAFRPLARIAWEEMPPLRARGEEHLRPSSFEFADGAGLVRGRAPSMLRDVVGGGGEEDHTGEGTFCANPTRGDLPLSGAWRAHLASFAISPVSRQDLSALLGGPPTSADDTAAFRASSTSSSADEELLEEGQRRWECAPAMYSLCVFGHPTTFAYGVRVARPRFRELSNSPSTGAGLHKARRRHCERAARNAFDHARPAFPRVQDTLEFVRLACCPTLDVAGARKAKARDASESAQWSYHATRGKGTTARAVVAVDYAPRGRGYARAPYRPG
ncbi:hypothetical protein FB107DRAFT_280566 [Schizophyllum commune]